MEKQDLKIKINALLEKEKSDYTASELENDAVIQQQIDEFIEEIENIAADADWDDWKGIIAGLLDLFTAAFDFFQSIDLDDEERGKDFVKELVREIWDYLNDKYDIDIPFVPDVLEDNFVEMFAIPALDFIFKNF